MKGFHLITLVCLKSVKVFILHVGSLISLLWLHTCGTCWNILEPVPGAEASEGRSNMLVDDASHSRFAEKYEKNKETLETTEDIQGEVLPAKGIRGLV